MLIFTIYQYHILSFTKEINDVLINYDITN
jgi:hypothetical protein